MKHEERARLITEAQGIMDKVESESRSLTAEEHERLDRIFEDVDAFDARAKQSEAADRVKELSKSLDEPVGRIATAARAAHRISRSDDEYRTAFNAYIRTGQPQAELRTLSSGTTGGATGGYVVPETVEARIVEKLYQDGIMRQLCTVRSTPDDRKIAVENGLGTASYVSEGSAISQNDVSFSQVTVQAHKAATSIQVNRELMDDAVFDLESYLVDKLTLRISRLTEESYLNGTLATEPSGLLTGLSTGYQFSTGTTTTIPQTKAPEIYDWLHSLPVQYRAGAAILCSDSFVKVVRKTQDNVGQFLWQPALAQGAPATIAGIPYYVSEHFAAVAANAIPAVYGLFRYHEIYDRGGTEMLVDPYTNSLNWRTNIHVVRRTDSVRTLDEAFTTLKMSAT